MTCWRRRLYEAMAWTAQIAPSSSHRNVSIYGGANEIQRKIITRPAVPLTVIRGARKARTRNLVADNSRFYPRRRRVQASFD